MSTQRIFPSVAVFQSLSPEDKVAYMQRFNRRTNNLIRIGAFSILVIASTLNYIAVIEINVGHFPIRAVAGMSILIALLFLFGAICFSLGNNKCKDLLFQTEWHKKEQLPALLDVVDSVIKNCFLPYRMVNFRNSRPLNWALRNLPFTLRDAAQAESVVLTPRHKKNLNSLFDLFTSSDGIYALLAYLDRHGDSSCVPYLKRLSNGKGRAAGDMPLQQAATYCLTQVEQRLAQANSPQILLRASNPSLTAEALLRPAPSESPSSSKEMLRPVPASEHPES